MKFNRCRLVLTPYVGANIEDCLYEAFVMAFKERRVVEITHNDRKMIIDPDMILAVQLKTSGEEDK